MPNTPTNANTEALPETTEAPRGTFFGSLVRSNRKIREDRAISIAEDAQLIYRRTIEDLETEIKRLMRDRNNMLDLSPTTADSLIVASDFDAKAFVTKDIKIAADLRNLGIQLELAKARYETLFGGE